MPLTTGKFIIPDGAPSGGEQPTASSTYGTADLARVVSGVGWANYADSVYTSGSPLQLDSGNSYTAQITIDGLATGSTTAQWPTGVTEVWNTSTNKLVGINEGDMFDYRLSFLAKDGASSALIDITINIGGTIGDISRRSVGVSKGASVETAVEVSSEFFTGSTFLANGGTINVSTANSSTDMDIWDIKFLVYRKYVGL